MKKIFAIALGALLLGCVTEEASVEPVLPEMSGDPNPYADYGRGMASDKDLPMAVEWHNAHGAELAAATAVPELKKHLASRETMDALLAKVDSAYETDALTAHVIAAVSQLTMCRKWEGAPEARKLWTAALIESAETTGDAYKTLFYLDQLRWCGLKENADKIANIGKKSSDKAVKEFAALVVRELKAAK